MPTFGRWTGIVACRANSTRRRRWFSILDCVVQPHSSTGGVQHLVAVRYRVAYRNQRRSHRRRKVPWLCSPELARIPSLRQEAHSVLFRNFLLPGSFPRNLVPLVQVHAPGDTGRSVGPVVHVSTRETWVFFVSDRVPDL
jgi:hypothetical protein